MPVCVHAILYACMYADVNIFLGVHVYAMSSSACVEAHKYTYMHTNVCMHACRYAGCMYVCMFMPTSAPVDTYVTSFLHGTPAPGTTAKQKSPPQQQQTKNMRPERGKRFAFVAVVGIFAFLHVFWHRCKTCLPPRPG